MRRALVQIATVLALLLMFTSGAGCAALQALHKPATCAAELARPETMLKLDAGKDAIKRIAEDARAGQVPDERDLVAADEASRLIETAIRCARP